MEMFTPNLTCVVFIAMFLLFVKAFNAMVLKPVGEAIQQREQGIKKDIAAGTTARTDAADVVKAYETRMHDTRQQVQTIIRDAEAAAQKARQEKVQTVQKEGLARLEVAKKDIAAERKVLVGHLAEDEKVLVGTIIKKLLGDSASVNVDTDKARQVLAEEVS